MRTTKGSKSIAFLLILVSLFFVLFTINITNAYFTSGAGLDVHTTIIVNNLNLKVYQVSGTTQETEITSVESAEKGGSQTYIKLNATEISPDKDYDLRLVLRNEDASNNSLFVRYNIKFYAMGYNEDTLINVNIVKAASFVQDGDYYYYRSGSANAALPKGTSADLITKFSIPYSEFSKNNFNANTIKIVLTVEGYLRNSFS